jgi:hypothetical protein
MAFTDCIELSDVKRLDPNDINAIEFKTLLGDVRRGNMF